MRLQRLIAALALLCLCTWGSAAAAKAYKNFRVAIYIPVGVTIRLADTAEFNREFARVSSQLDFQKVYIEGYRGRTFATDAQLETVKRQFQSKGIQTEGGVTFDAGSSGGQFNTLDYENPVDRATAERASRLVARHFDELMLDDFFFYNTKSDADIAAKGNRSWTDYRIDKMHEVARNLVIGPAKQVNLRIKVIIKYPNWYEHFHGTGFDLADEAHMFDGIYTGTETRDPVITDQQLQQYESYEIIRYFDNVRPDGGNGGGWVDTYSIRSMTGTQSSFGTPNSPKRRRSCSSNGRPWRVIVRLQLGNGPGRRRKQALTGGRLPRRIRMPAGRPPQTLRCTLLTTRLMASVNPQGLPAIGRRTPAARTSCTIILATSACQLSSILNIPRARERSC